MTRVSMFGQLGGNIKLSGQLRGGGGGDRITIEPTLLSGQKIADYEINGESGELYCINDYNDLDNLPTIINPVDMVGASAGDDGSAGYVPKPVAGDEGKVLYGDGTWKSPDLFSIDSTERKTGIKFNGRDVYVISFTGLSLSVPSGGTWVYTGCNIPDLKEIVGYNISDGTNAWNPAVLYAAPQIVLSSPFAFTAASMIIYYTKTV